MAMPKGPRADTLEKYKAVQESIRDGDTIEDACAKAGLSADTYYKVKRMKAQGKPKVRAVTKTKGTKLTTVTLQPQPFSGGRIFALVGAPAEIMAAIRELR